MVTGNGEKVGPKFSKYADIGNDKLTVLKEVLTEAKELHLFGIWKILNHNKAIF